MTFLDVFKVFKSPSRFDQAPQTPSCHVSVCPNCPVFGQSESQSANGGKLKLECVTAASHVTSPVTSCFKINIVANICDNICDNISGNVCLLQYFYCSVWKCCYALRWILLHREVQSVIIRKGPKKKALLVCFYC